MPRFLVITSLAELQPHSQMSIFSSMVSQRALDRSKRKKAAIAGRLTPASNADLIAALVYCLRRFKHGEWTPAGPINAHYKTLNRRMRDAVYCAKRMLMIYWNKEKDSYFLRRHPEIELEPFGLRWIDWQSLNPDLYGDSTILMFESEHQNLWKLVQNFLLGEKPCPGVDSSYTPKQKQSATPEFPSKESFDFLAAHVQAEIADKVGNGTGIPWAKAAQPESAPKVVIREINGEKFRKPLEDTKPAKKHILGHGPKYQL